MRENIANLLRKDKLKFELQILESSLSVSAVASLRRWKAVLKIDAHIVKLMMQIAKFAFLISSRKLKI